MDEYIKRQAVLDLISRKSYIFSEPPMSYEDDILLKLSLGYYRGVEKLPATDVEEVIHAHWDMVEREAFWLSDSDIWMKSGKPTKHFMPVCSHCKTEFGKIVLDYKRCPECGARMDKEVSNA